MATKHNHSFKFLSDAEHWAKTNSRRPKIPAWVIASVIETGKTAYFVEFDSPILTNRDSVVVIYFGGVQVTAEQLEDLC